MSHLESIDKFNTVNESIHVLLQFELDEDRLFLVLTGKFQHRVIHYEDLCENVLSCLTVFLWYDGQMTGLHIVHHLHVPVEGEFTSSAYCAQRVNNDFDVFRGFGA